MYSSCQRFQSLKFLFFKDGYWFGLDDDDDDDDDELLLFLLE